MFEVPMKLRFLLSLAFWLVLVASVFGEVDADKNSLYIPGNVQNFFDKNTKAELNITSEQEKALRATQSNRDKIWRAFVDESLQLQLSTAPAAEKGTKLRKMQRKTSDDLFLSYEEVLRPEQLKRMKQIVLQIRAMGIFDYQEVRDTLKIGDKEVKAMQAAFGKLLAEINADLKAKKITLDEASKRTVSLQTGVPDKAREPLSQEQKNALNDLLGEKFDFNKR
jgi:hypothetical protein